MRHFSNDNVLARLGTALVAASFLLTPVSPARAEAGDEAVPNRVAADLSRLPVRFEPNLGQTSDEVRFLSRGSGYAFFITPEEVVLALRKGVSEAKADATPAERAAAQSLGAVLRMTFAGGAAPTSIEGVDELPGVSNYFVGPEARWRTGVPGFEKVRAAGVYPGIDVVYYGNGRQIEYDFVVAPGADPRRIAVKFDGADRIELGEDGALRIHTPSGIVTQSAPVLYQDGSAAKRQVDGRYVLGADNTVAFEVSDYDASRELVIDPVLSYSTYLGGGDNDIAEDIRVDGAGNAYIVGQTASTNFPTRTPIETDVDNNGTDVFVTKLAATGNALVYSTYLGGGDVDLGTSIDVDGSGAAYVTGSTASTNFPTTAGAIETDTGNAGTDAFLAKLSPAGTALAYSTYLGGAGEDFGTAVVVSGSGEAYVTGHTTSTDFPTVSPLQTDAGDSNADVFVTRVNAAGSAILFSTYLSGNGDDAGFGIDLGATGDVFVTGQTSSTNFVTLNPIQTNGDDTAYDAFVTRINAANTGLVYSTYLGGSGNDFARDIVVDAAGTAYLTGFTASTDFPTRLPILIEPGDSANDAFVTAIAPTGAGLTFSTYLGGNGPDAGDAIAIGADGLVVVGTTNSTNFPTEDRIQADFDGANADVFVTRLNLTATDVLFSTYLGGSENDFGTGVDLDRSGNIYVTGYTGSTNFPTQGPLQGDPNDDLLDAFVVRIGTATADLTITKSSNAATIRTGEQVTYTITVTNNGPNAAGDVVVTDALPEGTTFASATATEGTVTGPTVGARGTVTASIGRLEPGESATVTIVANVTAAAGASVTNTAVVVTSALDANVSNNTSSAAITVGAAIVPPDVQAVTRLKDPFRLRLTGTNFQPGVQVFIGTDTTPWPSVRYVSTTTLVLKGQLKPRFPRGVPVTITVRNPDGGEDAIVYTR